MTQIAQQKAQLAQILAQHRQTMPDSEWLDYYTEIGFPAPVAVDRTNEEKIMAAVHFDAAESGLMPDWFYQQ